MLKLKSILLLVVAVSVQQMGWAQGSTKSPYSRYAYGSLADQSISAGHAMGGLGYGLRKSTQINPMNPASYSAVDSLTFLFDLGVDFQYYTMKDESGKVSGYNGNIRNMNLLFPLGKGFAFSMGFLPVSYVGYEYGEVNALSQINYYGTGGLQQVYGGLAYKHGNFSVGANIGYLFGDLSHFRTVYPGGGNIGVLVDSIVIRSHDLTYTLGVQQVFPVDKGKSFVIGASYTPKLKMSAKGTQNSWIGGEPEAHKVTSGDAFEMAQSLGVGASFVQNEKWTVGADVLWENWEKAKIYNVSDSLNNRFRYTAGVEFIPNSRSRNFLDRIQYRGGAYYSNSYITTNNGVKYDEFGLSVGMGLPVFGKSILNVSFDYVNVNPSVSNALSENYFKVTLSYTFNETWFRKWRLH